MKAKHQFDVVIIGGGIAGMTAAVYGARANRTCVILESNITGGLANSTYTVENFPSYVSIHGMELMQKVRDQVDELGVTVEEVCEIESFTLDGPTKTIETFDAMYEAKSIIIATGRKPIPLELPTECEQVHYCAICDGAPYKGKKVIVVGGGNSAFDEGLYLLQLGVAHLTIVEKMDRFFAAKATQDTMFANKNVAAYTDTVVKDVRLADGALTAVLLENSKTGESWEVEADGVFVFLGQEPNSSMFQGIIEMDKSGYILADENMQTNIPGVFSAGDINVKQFRQLTTAAADGTIAILMADRYIRSL